MTKLKMFSQVRLKIIIISIFVWYFYVTFFWIIRSKLGEWIMAIDVYLFSNNLIILKIFCSDVFSNDLWKFTEFKKMLNIRRTFIFAKK